MRDYELDTESLPMLDAVQDQLHSGIDSETIAAGNAIAHQIAATDWLGPLAPIALSPFFGLAALSGAATYGPEWLHERTALLSADGPLNNPALFWSMLILAIMTSLPRFTKVSKPIALIADNLETYSAIVILIAVRFAGMMQAGGSDEASLQAQVMLAAGFTLPWDILMSIFVALNILVINLVKLFFEFLVWLVPFPTVDLILEVSNKVLCVGLMALYMYSPTIATILNLFLLTICALIFGWCYRRIAFYREIVCGPILAWLVPSWFAQRNPKYRMFTAESIGNLPRLSLVTLELDSDGTAKLRGRWLWKSAQVEVLNAKLTRDAGLIQQRLVVEGDGQAYTLIHRRWVSTDDAYETGAQEGKLATA